MSNLKNLNRYLDSHNKIKEDDLIIALTQTYNKKVKVEDKLYKEFINFIKTCIDSLNTLDNIVETKFDNSLIGCMNKASIESTQEIKKIIEKYEESLTSIKVSGRSKKTPKSTKSRTSQSTKSRTSNSKKSRTSKSTKSSTSNSKKRTSKSTNSSTSKSNKSRSSKSTKSRTPKKNEAKRKSNRLKLNTTLSGGSNSTSTSVNNERPKRSFSAPPRLIDNNTEYWDPNHVGTKKTDKIIRIFVQDDKMRNVKLHLLLIMSLILHAGEDNSFDLYMISLAFLSAYSLLYMIGDTLIKYYKGSISLSAIKNTPGMRIFTIIINILRLLISFLWFILFNILPGKTIIFLSSCYWYREELFEFIWPYLNEAVKHYVFTYIKNNLIHLLGEELKNKILESLTVQLTDLTQEVAQNVAMEISQQVSQVAIESSHNQLQSLVRQTAIEASRNVASGLIQQSLPQIQESVLNAAQSAAVEAAQTSAIEAAQTAAREMAGTVASNTVRDLAIQQAQNRAITSMATRAAQIALDTYLPGLGSSLGLAVNSVAPALTY